MWLWLLVALTHGEQVLLEIKTSAAPGAETKSTVQLRFPDSNWSNISGLEYRNAWSSMSRPERGIEKKSI